jgi:cell division protein FtsQ
MDGGGRFLQPMTAGQTGGLAVRATTPWTSRSSGFRLPRWLVFGSRRSSVSVPIERRIPRFVGTGLALAFAATVVAAGLVQGGHIKTLRERYGEPHHVLARLLGLGIDRVTISGLGQLREAEVLAAAGISPKTSLLFIDAGEIRQRLESVPLIKSAAVRKLFPNELIVTIEEREPHAIWQLNGELFIIAADGTVIAPMNDARFAGLPLVVGEQANLHTKDYLALLDAAGPLRGRIRAGTLVSGRRWTLKMDNGMDVRLPELGVGDALVRLVKLEREQKILDKDVIALDLRMPDRIVVRLTEEAAAARAEAMKKKPMRGKGVDT